jgi:hypothetical protein
MRSGLGEKMGGERHHWTRNDDIVAFYLERHGDRQLPFGEAKIAKILSLKESSLAMRRANFGYLDGRQGLDHAAEQSREVFAKYKGRSEIEMRPLVLRILGLSTNT